MKRTNRPRLLLSRETVRVLDRTRARQAHGASGSLMAQTDRCSIVSITLSVEPTACITCDVATCWSDDDDVTVGCGVG